MIKWIPLGTMLGALLLGLLMPCDQALATAGVAAELKDAQALLAKGQYERAFDEYHRIAAEKNNPLAQFTLGLFFQYGWGRPADAVAACSWFEKAAAGKIPAAAHFFAECLENGVGRPADPGQAVGWYQKAVALGHHASSCALAELYMTGKGVPKDPALGLALCRQAAEHKVVSAQVQTALYLLAGDESIRDYDEAFAWFSAAAQANAPEAQYYLGIMLRDGLGRAKAPDQARWWFEKASRVGYRPAYFPTGELYFNAPPGPQTGKLSASDLAKAYLWTSAAARQTQDRQGRKKAEALLNHISAVMPASWKPELDEKVDAHFSTYPLEP